MADEPKITRILSDESDRLVSIGEEPPIRHEVKGFHRGKALDLWNNLIDRGFACSIKHLGGFYFVEVPVGLQGDPCYQQNAVIQTLALNAGCKTIQTGHTLRIVG